MSDVSVKENVMIGLNGPEKTANAQTLWGLCGCYVEADFIWDFIWDS